ncbi:MAG: hypothetical protein LC687_06910 [Actinobacteria bacterium]|nr:hypothetical protein [Actinomycetota bacterium]
MDSQKQRRPVQRNRTSSNDGNRACSGERQICLPLSKQQYDDIWDDSAKVRIWIDHMVERSPELFPHQIAGGYQLKGKLPASAKMPDIQLRQIQIAGQRYYLRPSFVMPAFSGTTDEVKQPLELLAHGVPLWLIVKVFGHDEMFWLRQEQRPKTVNTDGWFSTQNAFTTLFPGIVTILCFLHGFLKVRDRGRSEHELPYGQ